ncbi:hypothetical protein G7Y79_00006g019100 [Physcia stellaris]|nr:hypothetical protein G7Y79_00006g019100 [Physcia stellaris]
MDPFSVTVGVASLLELSLKVGKVLLGIRSSIASFEEDVASLLYEIRHLQSVNSAIEHLYSRTTGQQINAQKEPHREIWRNTEDALRDCLKTIRKVEEALEAIVGKKGGKNNGLLDAIGKHLRKQAREGELKQLQLKLAVHRESLNMSLTLLNLLYTQQGSEDMHTIGFQLLRQIAALQSQVASIHTNAALRSATAVASTLNLNRHFDTPKTVSKIFTGRKGYLDELQQAYDASHISSADNPLYKRFVVFGLGGSGKTQFCCKFASVNKHRFWAVFTVDASSPGNAQQSFIAIAKACGTIPNERAVKSWLSSIDRPWLLLIDNADDTSLDIEKYLPDGEHGLTLITTRNPSVRSHGTIGRRFYRFDRLEDDEANELLLKAAEKEEPWTSITMQLASAITQKLGALPLALVHAGNAIKAKYCEMSDYISYYEERWHNIRQDRHLAGHDEDEAEYIEVYASYEIVFRGLEAINTRRYRDAVQLLKLFSFFHYEHVPFDVLLAAVDFPPAQRSADAQEAVRASAQQPKDVTWLTRPLGLIEWVFSKEFERQNPVILPTFLRDAELGHLPDGWQSRLREALFLLTQLSLVTYYEASESYSMHPLIKPFGAKQVCTPCRDVFRFLHSTSERILTEITHESCSLTLYRSVDFIGRLNKNIECGDFVQAAENLKIVMEFNRNYLGASHPRTERVALAMAGCLWQQCRVNEAADVQEKVYEENRKSLGSDHPRTLKLMGLLGESRRHQGRFAESLQLLDKALTGMRRQLPDTDPATYRVLEQLGISLRVCFQFRKACRCLEEAVAGLDRCLGNGDIGSLVTREHLAITYIELGTTHKGQLSCEYLNAAHEIASFVVEKRTVQLGDKQPLTWQAQGTLGRTLAAKGAIVEAEKIFSSILPVAARHLGDDHVGVLSHKNHYSKILMQQNRLDDAEIILLEISRPSKYDTAISLGDHPDRWDALWNLVICYLRQGKINQSLCVCEELLGAVIAIQDGKLQTETSKAFWTLVQHKREEILALKANDATVTPASTMFAPNCDQNLAPIPPGIQAKSSGVQIAAVNLRARGTTW